MRTELSSYNTSSTSFKQELNSLSHSLYITSTTCRWKAILQDYLPTSAGDYITSSCWLMQMHCDYKTSSCRLMQMRGDGITSSCWLMQMRCDYKTSSCWLMQMRCDCVTVHCYCEISKNLKPNNTNQNKNN